MSWYVGCSRPNFTFEAFTSKTQPTPENNPGNHVYVIGPFKTERAALWAEKYGRQNPHFQHVEDAERLCRRDWK